MRSVQKALDLVLLPTDAVRLVPVQFRFADGTALQLEGSLYLAFAPVTAEVLWYGWDEQLSILLCRRGDGRNYSTRLHTCEVGSPLVKGCAGYLDVADLVVSAHTSGSELIEEAASHLDILISR